MTAPGHARVLVAALCWLAGCGASADELQSERAGPLPGTMCVEDTDCGADSRCRDGLCVADATDPLTLYLHVLPSQYPSGGAAAGVWLEALRVEGPLERDFRLPAPTDLLVEVVHAGQPTEAEVRLRSIPPLSSLPQREWSLRTTSGALETELPTGSPHAIVVAPDDEGLPPVHMQVVAGDEDRLHVDYDELALSAKRFVFTGDAATLRGTVAAFHAETGWRVSSRATTEGGEVTLTFAPGDYAYLLRITPEAAADAPADPCGHAAPAGPSYEVQLPATDAAASEFSAGADMLDPAERPARFVADEGPSEIHLPSALPVIAYRGTVALCETAGARAAQSVPVNLQSTEVLREEPGADPEAMPEPDALVASLHFAAATSADRDPDSDTLQFCAAVLPGTYAVVSAPPGSVECGVLAERRLVKAPPGSDAKTGDSVTLPEIATASGQLTTMQGDAVPHATLSAGPLPATDAVSLADGDPGLTGYNRSHQTTSDDDGAFTLPLDVGAYDLTIKPQEGSGLGWLVVRDVLIATQKKEVPSNFRLDPPLPLGSSISYSDPDDQLSLAGARIRAFTRLGHDGEGQTARTVEVAETTADTDGHFELLISPSIRAGLLGEL